MRKWLILLALSAPGVAFAQQVSITKEALAATSVSASSCGGSTNWTGWVLVNKYRSVVWQTLFDGDASPATTAVTMRCETSDSAATSNDSGYDVHILSDSATAGTSDSVTHTWSNAVTADERWTWTVANLPHNYVNCLFTCTSGNSDDTVTVHNKRITP